MNYTMNIGNAFAIGKEGSMSDRLRYGFKQFSCWNQDLLVQEKLDGWHATVIKKDGKTVWQEGWFQYSALQDFLQVLDKFLPDDSIIDGEILYGTQSATEKVQKLGYLQYVIFDVVKWNGEWMTNKTAIERFEFIENIWILSEFNVPDQYISLVKTMKLSHRYTDASLQYSWIMFNKIIDEGGEGIVIKKASSLYLVGERNPDIWKVKKYLSKDYVVMGFTKATAPTHIAKGFNVSAMICGLYVDGILKEITQIGSFGDAERKAFSDNPENYIGKVAELGAYEIFKSGALRHGMFVRFRDDKKAEEEVCIW